jgi:hypothetical protein
MWGLSPHTRQGQSSFATRSGLRMTMFPGQALLLGWPGHRRVHVKVVHQARPVRNSTRGGSRQPGSLGSKVEARRRGGAHHRSTAENRSDSGCPEVTDSSPAWMCVCENSTSDPTQRPGRRLVQNPPIRTTVSQHVSLNRSLCRRAAPPPAARHEGLARQPWQACRSRPGGVGPLADIAGTTRLLRRHPADARLTSEWIHGAKRQVCIRLSTIRLPRSGSCLSALSPFSALHRHP